MIRVLLLFSLMIVVSMIASWFVNHDGLMTMEWMGYRIDMNVSLAVGAIALSVIILFGALEVILWIRNTPHRLAKQREEKRIKTGLKCLAEGFSSIAIGDLERARNFSRKASLYLEDVPLTTLLSAQIAQIEGDPENTRKHLTKLMEHKETELVAMKGLLIQARKEGNTSLAIRIARRTVQKQPEVAWGHRMLIDLFNHTSQWEEAQLAVEKAVLKRALSPDNSKRLSAILYLARSMKSEKEGNRGDALLYAGEAYKNAPNFAPAIAQLSKMFMRYESKEKAVRLIEKHWKECPHPELSDLYLDICLALPFEKRLKRVERLADTLAEHRESQILVARAALDAGDIGKARDHLRMALSQGETSAVCRLMAEIEEKEENDTAALQWRERASNTSHDHHWTCTHCGHPSHSWTVHCGHCKSFDSLEWRAEREVDVITPEERITFSL
ncbi:MAG: enzyme of heme biosynthesis (hemY-like) [Rickettsiales bacterium]|nr:enzyme of heme biosynthesis (hemY-like) [Rickettsiales bacterium]